jgi:hypothetical protein
MSVRDGVFDDAQARLVEFANRGFPLVPPRREGWR